LISNPKFLPYVSVIVPIYNGEADLPELIRCLQAQTYPSDRVEYLLVDNGSCDRTATLLQTAVKEAASLGITLQYLQEDRIQSSYAARNTGIRAAKGEIIAFTDADCRPQPDWLDALIPPFSDSTIGVVVGEIVALPGKTLLEHHAERQKVLSQQHTLKHPFYPYGQTANLAARRRVLEQVGLFRPYLTTGGDADLCWRIQQQSDWTLHFAPKAIVQHRHRSTLKDYHNQWRRYGRSNRYLHELHGVELMRDRSPQEYLYLLGRWLVKELPVNSMKAIALKTPAIDIISTPLGLFAAWSRTAGQRETELPEKAKEIEWLENVPGMGCDRYPE
jgi:cellulose synthase/poly-beta-1,6-N-acetylglucosamine synthase-like glycosyltransferase